MRTRSVALVLALMALCLLAASASAAVRSVPLAGTPRLSTSPPVRLPAASSRPSPGAGGGHRSAQTMATAPLPRTGADVRLVSVIGVLMLMAGLGLHVRERRRRG